MKERDLRKLLHQPIHVGIPKGELIGNGKLTMAIARTSGRAALSWYGDYRAIQNGLRKTHCGLDEAEMSRP
jgi:hypothetical protein